MNIALAYFSGDRDQTIRWMEWVRDLGGLGNHKLFTIHAFNCAPVSQILPFTEIPDAEKVISNWQDPAPARSAAAPNSMLRQLAWFFYYQKIGPWVFMEPDAVPLKAGWIDQLEREYHSKGKPFMGARVLIDKVPEHLSGNSVLPQNVPELAPTLIMRANWQVEGKDYELAFDIAGAQEVLKQAAFTTLIQHKFRHPGFKSRKEFEETIDPNAVIFHSNKDGSIFKYLRGGDVECQPTQQQETILSPPSGLTQTLVEKSEAAISSDGVAKVQPSAAPTRLERLRANAAKARAAKAAKRKAGDVECDLPKRMPEKSESDGLAQNLTEPHSNGEPTVQPAGSPMFTGTYTWGASPELIERALAEPNGNPPIRPPWQDKAASLREIRQYAAALKLFCGAPIYVRRVRDELRNAGVIK